MKKILVFTCLILLLYFSVNYYKTSNPSEIPYACNISKEGIDVYEQYIVSNKLNFKNDSKELDRQATDGSLREIYRDKNNKIVLVQDTHSGESGFRVVSVILKEGKVVKIIDELTAYKIPPIEDPTSTPTVTKDEFYVDRSEVCFWYKQDIQNSITSSEDTEYKEIIQWIIQDAELL